MVKFEAANSWSKSRRQSVPLNGQRLVVLAPFCPDLQTHSFGVNPADGFEAVGEIVCGGEVGEVLAQLLIILVVVALHRRLLDCPVHALDVPIGPQMVRFGRLLINRVRAQRPVHFTNHL
jgi:hypothetical protein